MTYKDDVFWFKDWYHSTHVLNFVLRAYSPIGSKYLCIGGSYDGGSTDIFRPVIQFRKQQPIVCTCKQQLYPDKSFFEIEEYHCEEIVICGHHVYVYVNGNIDPIDALINNLKDKHESP